MSKSAKRKTSRNHILHPFLKRGISKGIILVIVAVVLIAGGGFFYLSQSGGGVGLPLVGKTFNPNCELNDPELCKFMNNWSENKNYKVTTVMNDPDGKMESISEISGENSHILTKMDGQEQYNMITIGNTSYTKDYSDNTWVKYTAPDLEDLGIEEYTSDFEFDDETVESTTEYKFIAKEACGNLTCFKYEIVDASFTGHSYIWFDDREYLLRKQSTEEGEIISESIFEYSPLNISEPSPIKEGTAAQPMGGYPQMSDEDQAAYEEAMQQFQQTAPAAESDYYEEVPVDETYYPEE